MPALSAAGRGFKIAEGYVSIETRVDNDSINRVAKKVGEKGGDDAGRRFFRRFSDTFNKSAKTDRKGFLKNLAINLFKRDPDLMRTLLHPIEATFARPFALMVGAAVIGPLAG